MTATHPTDRELEDFLLGKLVAPDDLAVESHLAECDECRERAVQVPADDTLTELLAAARTLVESRRSAAPTPTLDGSATPPAFAPTLAWDGSASADESKAPPALAQHPKYRVVRRLGSGGMGTVWLAEHLVMHRPVAVKVIRPDLLARPGATGRFLREVRAAAKLHHPNIVTAFDAEPVGDSCLLVMEYVPGQTLGERLEAGRLPVDEACRVIRDAARGLAHAHAAGLVHRDVKPHNLIRAADGTTKVLDFGLAGVGGGEVIPASGDRLTGAGMVVGTPDYIAPEQIANPHAADARADIYGLGCTLYHLLAGRPPLPDGSVAEKLAAQKEREADPIPELPPGLAEVLAKMMAKRPEDRYQSADDLIAALEPFSGIPMSREAPPKRRRLPMRWFALAAGLLLLATGAVIYKIERDNQIVQVEVDDPDIEVVMKRKGEIVLIRDAKTNQTWEFDTIKNQIGMVDQPEGLKLGLSNKEPFVLWRKGERAFTVRRLDTWSSMLDSSRAAKMEDATRAAEAWLKLYDAGAFARTWEESAAIARRSTTRDDWMRLYREAAQKSGKARSRSVSNRQFATKFKDVDGEYIVLSYETDFELGKRLTEQIVIALDPDGHWRVASYGYTKHPAILADPNAQPLTPGKNPLGNPSDAADDRQAKINAATRAAEAWLKLLDAGDGGRAWDAAAVQLHRAIPRDDLIRMYRDLAQKAGKLQARSIVRRQYPANLRGSPESECVGIEYQARYERDKGATELMFVVLEGDGNWRVASYSFTSRNTPPSGDQGADRPAAAAAKSDRELILGAWRGVSAEVGGEQMPPGIIDTVQPTLTFTADKVVARPQGTVPKPFLEMAVAKGMLPKEAATIMEKGTEGIYHLDPSKSPRQIDFTILGEIKRTGLGIYQLDGDTLKVCVSIDPAKVDQRPTEFATKAGEMRVLITFKRQTGAEGPKADPPTPGKN